MFLQVAAIVSLLGVAMPVSTSWRPISRPLSPALPPQTISYQSHIPEPSEDGCTLYKALFDQESPTQYMQYKAPVPDMKEFTLCMWHKFYNHSRDQPLFTYSSSHERARDIYSWVSNDEKSSFYMLSVMGQTMYRLNYPVRLHKWYHLCQSWNGRTGEWQIWINSERIGRGFHNLLVGKIIKGGGVALSGQEPINNAVRGYQDLYKPVGGLLGEVTLLQLYKAALTAGKAYTNHKHHHAHKFHHDDKLGEDDYRIDGINPAPSPEPVNTGNEYPFLRHGQLIPTLPVHELSAYRGQQNSLNPQLNVLGTSVLGPGQENLFSSQHMRLYKRDHKKDVATPTPKSVIRRVVRTKSRVPIQPLDTDEEDEIDGKMAFKRDVAQVIEDDENENVDEIEEIKSVKRDVENIDKTLTETKITFKRSTVNIDGNGNKEDIDKMKIYDNRNYNTEEIEKRKTDKVKNSSQRSVENGEGNDDKEKEKRTSAKKAGEKTEGKDGKIEDAVKRGANITSEDKKEEIKEDSSSKLSSLKPLGERERRSQEDEILNNEESNYEIRSKSKRETDQTEKVQKKRTALLGDAPFGVIPGADLSGLFAGDGYILGAGGLKFNDDNNHYQAEGEAQMEPAEWEVRSIMAVCTGCSEDPFRKATLISWRETPKKLFSGVLYIPAIQECQRF